MANYKREFSYERFSAIEKMNETDAELMHLAEKAAGTAHAPYSGFRVGAALLLDDGAKVQGSNQENAAYPACICAERVALTSAAVQYPGRRILSIAVAAYKGNKKITTPGSPCGECRQMIAEFEQRQGKSIRIIMKVSEEMILISDGVESLLPFHFNGEQLK